MAGDLLFGSGADTLVQTGSSAGITGMIDGGDGTDSYVVDTTAGAATLAASRIINFERITQTGNGTGSYSGTFGIDTIMLAGGTLSVAAGQTLATKGTTTITGVAGSGPLSVVNAGIISGNVVLADGDNTVTNNGTIGGAVQLGSGNDTYVEGVGSSVGGGVDGGTGTNLYRVVLAGARNGIGARSRFQQLAVDGTGTLALTLDQDFQSIALAGPNLSLTLGTYSVGQITATGAATQLTLDRDVGQVTLGSGTDTLTIGAATLAGRYDGGAGSDTLRLTNAGAVTIAGAVSGFETLTLAGNALTISGTLGNAGQSIALTGGDKTVAVAAGGTIAGAVNLGAGNDSLWLAAGGTITGTVSGGAGSNMIVLDLTAGDLALRLASVSQFQRLTTQGSGTVTLNGGSGAYDAVTVSGNLTVASDASLSAPVTFGIADNRFAIAGGFAGSVDGGAGSDSIDVSGGGTTTPVAFSTIANVEAFRISAGYATVSGTASLGSVALTGGRLVGLTGSSLTAGSVTVGQGATFGSAGTVNGNLAVVGTLSPSAPLGTMTVNGNVSLAAASTSLFDITSALSDKLVINGALTIANGATLQLAATGALAPGKSVDLVTASGGITGSYGTIIKSASLFGFVTQDANRIRLLGEFLNDTSYSGQVQRSIDYLNGVLTNGQPSAALLAALPLFVTSSGGTNVSAFMRLSPEPYAAARQIGVENGLTLVGATRGDAFAPTPDTTGVFTFASALTGTRTLEADPGVGTAQTTINSYGFLAGVGIAGTYWSLGAFGGWLKDHQRLSDLDARTSAAGVVAGLHGRAYYRGIGVKATIAYDGAQADTNRALPTGRAYGSYDLHGWIADASIDATMPLVGSWLVRPTIGATAIRTTRDGVAETGGGPLALTVAGKRGTAAFIDGGLTFAGTMAAGNVARVRPSLTIGARYQAEGRTPYALAGLSNAALGLEASGAMRAPVLATATLNVDIALSTRLALFGTLSGESGDADHRAAARTGVRLAF